MRTLNLNEYRFVYYNTRKAPSIVDGIDFHLMD